MHNLLNITQIIIQYKYLGIAAIAFLESGIIFTLPGDSLLFTAGILASGGILKIQLAIPIIFISSFFGGVFGYYIGTKLEKLRRFYFFRKILKEEYVNKAHVFFGKHGKFAIIFSRFVPILRTFTPIVAGVGEMNHLSFLKYSLVGALLWSMVVTLSGYFLGRSFPWLQAYMPVLILVVVILSILPAVFHLVRHSQK